MPKDILHPRSRGSDAAWLLTQWPYPGVCEEIAAPLYSLFPFQAHLLGEVPDRANDGEKRGCLAATDLIPELAGDGRRGRQDVSEQRQQQQQGLLRQEQEGPTPTPQKESGRLVRAQGFVILDTQERGV